MSLQPSAEKRSRADTTAALYAFDAAHSTGNGALIAGVDEVGRGPLAGPVVSAAVILDLSRPIAGINDSKKLSEKKREELYSKITETALAWSIGSASVDTIEKVNILQATFIAMRQALDGLKAGWTLALVDGNQMIPGFSTDRVKTVVKGDGLSASIAAASIVAKVTRDRLMAELHADFPVYDFAGNKGYGTASHCNGILAHGLCIHHRRSFCGNILSQTRLAL